MTTSEKIATAQDALDMLVLGGVDLAAELTNVSAAWYGAQDELLHCGFTDIDFNEDDLAAAIRDRLDDEK